VGGLRPASTTFHEHHEAERNAISMSRSTRAEKTSLTLLQFRSDDGLLDETRPSARTHRSLLKKPRFDPRAKSGPQNTARSPPRAESRNREKPCATARPERNTQSRPSQRRLVFFFTLVLFLLFLVTDSGILLVVFETKHLARVFIVLFTEAHDL
jgi:hypothetical protein